jgi:hypothetical protein
MAALIVLQLQQQSIAWTERQPVPRDDRRRKPVRTWMAMGLAILRSEWWCFDALAGQE